MPRVAHAFCPIAADFYDVIRKQDVIVHHPYDSFAPVEDFFKRAGRATRLCWRSRPRLYRVGKNSPVVNDLLEARDNEKQVTVLVELKARFDEENNLEWVTALEEKGVHVVYGVEELPVKTHAKISLVVRRERDGMRRYVHLGTGNYNAATARLYADIGLFTCNEQIADDASRLFNRLTGYAPDTTYNHLLVAPEYLQDTLLALIDNEIDAARRGDDARLIFKMNQLEDDLIIQKLYQASQAGVKIDLIVRGLCCLRPGRAWLKREHRRQEHRRALSRAQSHLLFPQCAGTSAAFHGQRRSHAPQSAQSRGSGLPVLDPRIQWRALRILQTDLCDVKNSWALRSDASYERLWDTEDMAAFDSHIQFMSDSFGLCDTPD